jgi:hypothetical protein
MVNIISGKSLSYAAKVVLDLYENREEIIESYKTSAKIVAERAEPLVDAAVDTFDVVKGKAEDLIDMSGIGTGFSRFFNPLKEISEKIEFGMEYLPKPTDLLAFGLIVASGFGCS